METSITQQNLSSIYEKALEQVLTMNKTKKIVKNVDEDKENSLENQNVLMDFSNFFKKKLKKKKKIVVKEEDPETVLQEKKNQNNVEENEEDGDLEAEKDVKTIVVEKPQIIDNEVPRNLTITQEHMRERRYLDQRRWFCLSRCQYKRSCGISSLVSVWNYLFSTLGTGNLPPISQEEALVQLGVCKDRDRYFGDVEFGAFTGNSTLIKWFRLLCKIYKVEGRAFIMWKNSGESRTAGVDQEVALQKLKDGLMTENNGFIYHAHDHYFCPMGFELTTQRPMDAYKNMEDIDPLEVKPWIFIGEPSKCYPCFHIKKWDDIVSDLTMGNPYYYNIRNPNKGVRERKGKTFQPGGKKFGSTINCLIQFQKVVKIQRPQMVKKQVEELPKSIETVESESVLQEKVVDNQ